MDRPRAAAVRRSHRGVADLVPAPSGVGGGERARLRRATPRARPGRARRGVGARPRAPRSASRGGAEPVVSTDAKAYRSFADFYPFYLGEHANRTSRRLHFVGTSVAIVLLLTAVWTRAWWLVVVALLEGYAFAWVGHF